MMGQCHGGCLCGATTGEPLGSEQPGGVGPGWEMPVLKRMLFWEMPAWAEIPFPGAELAAQLRGAAQARLPPGHPHPGAVSLYIYPRGSAPPEEGLNPPCVPGKCHRTLSPTPAQPGSPWACPQRLPGGAAGPRACPPGQRGRTGCAVLSGIFTRSDPASQSHSAFNSLSTPNLLLCI